MITAIFSTGLGITFQTPNGIYKYEDTLKGDILKWEGQKKGGDDEHVMKGTHCFHRTKASETFYYIGTVLSKTVVNPGDDGRAIPTTYELVIDICKPAPCYNIFADDPFKTPYKRSALKWLCQKLNIKFFDNAPYFKGIVKLTEV